MSWSVRTCTECGEYKYVEDGVCQDCQSSTSYLGDNYAEVLREALEEQQSNEIPKKGLGKSIKDLRREDVDELIRFIHHAKAEKVSEADVDADELAEELENGGDSV